MSLESMPEVTSELSARQCAFVRRADERWLGGGGGGGLVHHGGVGGEYKRLIVAFQRTNYHKKAGFVELAKANYRNSLTFKVWF